MEIIFQQFPGIKLKPYSTILQFATLCDLGNFATLYLNFKCHIKGFQKKLFLIMSDSSKTRSSGGRLIVLIAGKGIPIC